MKKLALFCLSLSMTGGLAGVALAQESSDEPNRPREGDVEREPGRRGERDGDRRREGDRERRGDGPRDGDRDGRGRGPRDGDRRRGDGPPRDSDRVPGGPLMAALDTNRNGVLESDEIDQAIVALRKLDRNEDGKLTLPELFGGRPSGDRPPGGRPFEGRPPREGEGRRGDAEMRREQMMNRFNEADSNDDGKLSRAEAPERMKQGFDRIDSNSDGFVDKAEFEQMIRRMSEGRGGRPPREGEGRRGRPGDGDAPRARPESE